MSNTRLLELAGKILHHTLPHG